jgi:hypothetical protein
MKRKGIITLLYLWWLHKVSHHYPWNLRGWHMANHAAQHSRLIGLMQNPIVDVCEHCGIGLILLERKHDHDARTTSTAKGLERS